MALLPPPRLPPLLVLSPAGVLLEPPALQFESLHLGVIRKGAFAAHSGAQVIVLQAAHCSLHALAIGVIECRKYNSWDEKEDGARPQNCPRIFISRPAFPSRRPAHGRATWVCYH